MISPISDPPASSGLPDDIAEVRRRSGNAHFLLVLLLWASDFQGFIAGVTMLITRVSFLPAATAPAKSAKLCPQIAPSAIGRGPCITYKVCTRMMYSESSRQNKFVNEFHRSQLLQRRHVVLLSWHRLQSLFKTLELQHLRQQHLRHLPPISHRTHMTRSCTRRSGHARTGRTCWRS